MYPSQHFPFGATFVCQAGNFWTLLRTYFFYLPVLAPQTTMLRIYMQVLPSDITASPYFATELELVITAVN